jgi:hypothetical protein
MPTTGCGRYAGGGRWVSIRKDEQSAMQAKPTA